MILSKMLLTFVGILTIELFLAGCRPSTVTQTKAAAVRDPRPGSTQAARSRRQAHPFRPAL